MMARENLGNESLLNKFLNTFGFGNAMYTSGEQKAIIYIRAIINLLLSLVTFIALVILLYSFYLMFFTEESKGIETVKKNMKGVVIALVILGLSRVIVSFIFSLFNRVKCPAGEQWSETKQKCEQQK
ncbi:MAG: pilin [Candidatus Peribacteria bacterium]|jgi:NADH:ubiquinone oxidoreductase subunit 5 (subunit L)/multisubunit Na+/H+ antiporter MnhA subunit|nr:pilin [Candidatus Peribacteria bacterium]